MNVLYCSLVLKTIEAATEADVIWAAEFAAGFYAGHDLIPASTMLEWYRKNPHGFSIVRDASGERTGNVDLLPVKPAALSRLVGGVIFEADLRAEDVYGPDERALITDLYLESVIAPGAGRVVREAFPALMARLRDTGPGFVYAIAASEAGARFLTKLGCVKVGEASTRADGHDLYRGFR